MPRHIGSKNRGPVVLSCLHMYDNQPLPNDGDTLWCAKCGKYSTYVEVKAEQRFVISCDKCRRVNKKTKVGGEIEARVKAERHARVSPDHTVTIFDSKTKTTLATVTGSVYVPVFSDE